MMAVAHNTKVALSFNATDAHHYYFKTYLCPTRAATNLLIGTKWDVNQQTDGLTSSIATK